MTKDLIKFANNIQGPRNDFFLRGALIKRKMRFCLFPKILLNKSPILRGARAPLAPLGPRPLHIQMSIHDLSQIWPEMNDMFFPQKSEN